MKKLNLILVIVLISSFLLGCSKNNEATGIQHPPQPPLSAKEYIFEDLTWGYFHHENDPDSIFDEVYVFTPARPDLFPTAAKQIQVFFKSETDIYWLQAHPVINGNCTPPYTYQPSVSGFVVFVCGSDYLQYVGKKVSLKVRIL